jgi:hypothetical protein
MNKIKSGVFVLIEVTDPARHVEYNWWHSRDHIPENLAIDGIVLGTRWAAPQRFMDARLVVHPAYAATQYLVCYLMTEPVGEVWREFVDLGDRMYGIGRIFNARLARYGGHHRLLKGFVAPRIEISPEALPFRPHKGVYIVMADAASPDDLAALRWVDDVHVPAMLGIPGVTGACWFRSRGPDVQPPQGDRTIGDQDNRHVLAYYLDEDPLEVVERLSALDPEHPAAPRALEQAARMTVVLAGPYTTIDDPRNYDLNLR